MRLYTTGSQWAGTQADAKKLGKFVEINVPTDKQGLLDWLNKMHWNDLEYMKPVTEPVAPVAEPSAPSEPRNLKGGSWDEYNAVRNHLETCDAKALNTALSIITGRLGDLLEGVK
tara:strand:+ start:70 stop:414 length:345 start_codon:yes stop_codon:yes gene_type:complete